MDDQTGRTIAEATDAKGWRLRRIFTAQNLAPILGGILLVFCILGLLFLNFRASSDLRKNLLRQFRQEAELEEKTIRYFFSDAMSRINTLSRSREVDVFFENKALGMSMEYGLDLSLPPIRGYFLEVVQNHLIQGKPVFLRIVLIDKSGKQTPEFYSSLWDALARGETWSGNFVNRRKDGTTYEDVAVISPVRDGEGRIINYVAVKRDVTSEKQMEEQLLQAVKMEAVGKLAGGIAHDFNNLLTGIMGYSDLLLRGIGSDSGLEDNVQEIRKAAERGWQTLLVAEDDDMVRELIRTILTGAGYKVLDAKDGMEAWEIAQRYKDPIHMLVTDVVMPRMGGRELADLFTGKLAGAKVLFLSGYTDDSIVRHGVLEAGVEYLQKPFRTTDLVQRIQSILDQ